ncbi:hypothetical protein AAFC00_005416 [Neodothiora populina]|uniref:RIC1 C-terminal alpha solenoid region domain-containing protein n=1 Tax=Neodothiora populina TaxID=2781224 RepID=A0ABR3PKS9_9PEZI
MYWPIGAPKIYAASKHTALTRGGGGGLVVCNDGLDNNANTLSHDDDDDDDDDDDEDAATSTTTRVNRRSNNNSNDNADTSDLIKSDDSNDDDTSAHRISRPATRDGGEDGGQEPVVNDLPAAPASSRDSNAAQDTIDIKIARGGNVFASITRSSLTVWQTKPTAALATVIRSERSLDTYGSNTALLLRPDALIIVVQTEKGFLVTYSLATDPSARVYQPQIYSINGSHTRRASTDGFRRPSIPAGNGPGEGEGIWEVNIRFRMVIRIDAGISKSLVLDEELVVATVKPAAIQCIRWSPDERGSSHSTELLKRMSWLAEKTSIIDIFYDRPMNLHTWITNNGRVYAVQRLSGSNVDPANPKSLFKGFCFHIPQDKSTYATKAAINARFSLIAVACADCKIRVYAAKDYLGNIPSSHELSLPVSADTSGKVTCMNYSPDGYCLFVGYEKGWALWSVYGRPGANTFTADRSMLDSSQEQWLGGVKDSFWIGAGSEIVLLGFQTPHLHVLEVARSSATGCFSMPNIARSLLQASTSIMIYKGLDATGATTISGETSLWQTVQIPQAYLASQWPIRLSVVSPDGRYIAVAGRRGLANYSVGSGRWKTFDDPGQEDSFTVRGGMCWWQHILVAAVESGNSYQVRLYSREKSLDNSQVLHTETLAYPVVCIAVSGEDSVLVYTYENILLHYIFVSSNKSVRLAQVGQIAFHGIIRAPPRVRSISWVLPEQQRENGDPSQDVATAAVLFLVDAKLVLLQPSANEHGELKYDMRVIAHDVEFYTLSRESPGWLTTTQLSSPLHLNAGPLALEPQSQGLRDSLWYFNGTAVHVWPEILDVLSSAPTELEREIPPPVEIPTDFYPLSIMVEKGIITGMEPELVQRRDVDFSYFRTMPRTHLFIPALLRHHLAQYDSSAALHLSHYYRKLPYFSHSLEILLHNVLDEEVDASPEPTETALLPSVLSFLSSFPTYLDIVAGCTRKTELRSWITLFKCLPPVQSLFEESLNKGMLKTAGSYLLILHAFDEGSFNAQQIATLLARASQEGDWELCKELARFVVGIDESGELLKSVFASAGLKTLSHGNNLSVPGERPKATGSIDAAIKTANNTAHVNGGGGYFGNGISAQ